MSQRITKIKVKQPNGQMSDPIPVGVQAENVKFKTSADKGDLQTRLVLLEDTIINKQDTIEGAATSIAHSNLREDKVLVSNMNGKVVASDTYANKLTYLNDVEVNIGAAINQKQNHNIGSASANKFLTVDSNGNIITSSNANKASLELVDLTGTKKLEDRLEEKQPKITNNSALVGSNFNLYDEKFPTDKRLKALASGTQGTIVTTNATYNDLQKLANIADVTDDSLTTVKAVIDSKATKAEVNTAIGKSGLGRSVTNNTLTLGVISGTNKTITIPAADANYAGLMSKADKANVDKIPNLIVNNLDSNSTDKALSASMGKKLADTKWEAFTNSNCINQTSKKITQSKQLADLKPGSYQVAIHPDYIPATPTTIFPETIASGGVYGTLIVAKGTGNYVGFILISTTGHVYVRHYGYGGNNWHANSQSGWIEITQPRVQTFDLSNLQVCGFIGYSNPSIIYVQIPIDVSSTSKLNPVKSLDINITNLAITAPGVRLKAYGAPADGSTPVTYKDADHMPAMNKLGLSIQLMKTDKSSWASTSVPKGSPVWITLTGEITMTRQY